MKNFLTSLLFIISVNAQNVWYVSPSGNNSDGSTWENAWTNLDQFTWETDISAGDTIYVDAGDYAGVELVSGLNPQELNNGLRIYFSTQVVVTRSYEAGHTGTVRFIKDQAEERAFRAYGIANVKFNGFTFSNIADVYTDNGNYSNCTIGYDSLIVMDSCRFVTIGNPSAVLNVGYSEKVTVQNSIIETMPNTYARAYDIITFGTGRGGITFKNNSIIQRSAYSGTSGTSNGAVTFTDTSLTDTRLTGGSALVPNYHKHGTITVGDSSYLFVDSNSTNTFYGVEWTGGGKPADGSAWYVNTAQHRDFIQWSEFLNTDPEFNLIVFDKNFMLVLTPEAHAYNMLFYSVSAFPQYGRMVFTNNILVVETAGITPLENCGGQYAIQNYTDVTNGTGSGVTTDNTSLTDTDLDMETDVFIGCRLTCAGETLTVTSNDNDTFFGTEGWSGETPPSGSPWSLATIHANHLNWTVINNTFITPNGGLSIDPFDSMIVKNNFFIGGCATDQAVMGMGYSNTHFDTSFKDVDYNHYWFPSWNSNVRQFRIYGGTSRNWGDWKAEGVDVNSDTGHISLADVRDSVIASYMPTEQIAGTDVSQYGVTTDILGNERTVWTIGALEFQSGTGTGTFKILGVNVSKVLGISPSKIFGIQ